MRQRRIILDTRPGSFDVLVGDAIEVLRAVPANSVHCVVTSPPYFGLRDYGTGQWAGGDPNCDHVGPKQRTMESVSKNTNDAESLKVPTMAFKDRCGKCGAKRVDKQIGMEPSPEQYVEKMVALFEEVRRVMRPDATLWLNLGDSYNNNQGKSGFGLHDGVVGEKAVRAYETGARPKGTGNKRTTVCKHKDLLGIPWMVAFALRAAGWWLRQDIIWCLSGGTWLYAKTRTSVGPMMLKDLARLDPATVRLWDGKRWARVLGWGPSRSKDRKMELVLRSGERIGCTGMHKWPTNRGLLHAKHIRPGDVIETCVHPSEGAAPKYMTADLAWVLGLYVAEGHMPKDKHCAVFSLCSDEQQWIPRITRVATALGATCTQRVDGNKLSVVVSGRVFVAAVSSFVGGSSSHDVHLRMAAWALPNRLLREVAKGYLAGDGHHEKKNGRWRLGFCRNYSLERDLRTLAARLGATIVLSPCTAQYQRGSKPAFRGEWRWTTSEHSNNVAPGTVVEVRRNRARQFWDVAVDGAPNLFALASGVLTHNCKPNPMPESVTDRCTKSHEYIFLLTKRPTYYYDNEAVREQPKPGNNGTLRAPKLGPGRPQDSRQMNEVAYDEIKGANKRSVWNVSTKGFADAHFATFPEDLIAPCILAGTSARGCCSKCGAPHERVVEKGEADIEHQRACGGDKAGAYDGKSTKDYAKHKAQDASATKARILAGMRKKKTVSWQPTCDCSAGVVQCVVLDPFTGSGTTGVVSRKYGRRFIGSELNPEYAAMARRRIGNTPRPLIAGGL